MELPARPHEPLYLRINGVREILQLIYDTLTEYDINLKAVPSLAESETASSDGRSFTYKLRSGAKWHDGKPVTSADVKYTYDTLAKNDVVSLAGPWRSSRAATSWTR